MTMKFDNVNPRRKELFGAILQASTQNSIKVHIGELFDEKVYLDVNTRDIHIGPMRFSVDHPYVQGTKIQETALAILNEGQV